MTDEQKAKLRQAYHAGVDSKQAAVRAGVSEIDAGLFYFQSRKGGLVPQGPPRVAAPAASVRPARRQPEKVKQAPKPKGEERMAAQRVSRVKLSEDKITEIQRLRRLGKTRKEIAAATGASNASVFKYTSDGAKAVKPGKKGRKPAGEKTAARSGGAAIGTGLEAALLKLEAKKAALDEAMAVLRELLAEGAA